MPPNLWSMTITFKAPTSPCDITIATRRTYWRKTAFRLQLRSVLHADSLVRGFHCPPLTGPERLRYFSPSTPLLIWNLMVWVYHRKPDAVNVRLSKNRTFFRQTFLESTSFGTAFPYIYIGKGVCYAMIHADTRKETRAKNGRDLSKGESVVSYP